jgi:hypothetical protein
MTIERAFDEARHEDHVRHAQHELIVAQRDLDLFAGAHDPRDLLHRFAGNDSGHGGLGRERRGSSGRARVVPRVRGETCRAA